MLYSIRRERQCGFAVGRGAGDMYSDISPEQIGLLMVASAHADKTITTSGA